MNWLKRHAGMCIAEFLDIGLGILIIHLLSLAFGYRLSWPWYGFGILFAIFVDADIILNRFVEGRISENHHDLLTHCPLPMFLMTIPTVFSAALLSGAETRFAWFLSAAAFVCLFSHYLHDSLGDDTKIGIKWLWPIKEDFYIFFGANGNGGVRKPLKIIPADKKIAVDSMEEWLKSYLRPTKRMIGGIILLVLAVVIALFWR